MQSEINFYHYQGGSVTEEAGEKAADSDYKHIEGCCRFFYKATILLTVLFLLASIVPLVLYFSSTISAVNYLENPPQAKSGNEGTMSLQNSLQNAVNNFNEFLKNAIKDGRSSTNSTVNKYKTDVSVRLIFFE